MSINVEDPLEPMRHNVLNMPLGDGKITTDLLEIMDGWRHKNSGFNVCFDPEILLLVLIRFYKLFALVSG
jgi:hypothetical protein